jgi:hypothetical protein
MSPEELGRLFESFRHSAFRLECLPSYDVTEDDEAEALRLFLDGKPEPPWRKHREWPDTVRKARQRGAQMQRVRLMETPPTNYQRFQCAWGYPANVEAGEDIRILHHRPDGLLAVDFWLFDDTIAVVLEYDDQGRFLVPVVAEATEPYRQARDLTLKSAVTFSEYRLSLLS